METKVENAHLPELDALHLMMLGCLQSIRFLGYFCPIGTDSLELISTNSDRHKREPSHLRLLLGHLDNDNH